MELFCVSLKIAARHLEARLKSDNTDVNDLSL